MNLNICMASDDNYATHLGICIVSIMKNNIKHNVNLHILNNNISEININKLKQIENDYSNLELYFYDVDRYFKENNINMLIKTELNDNDFYNLLGISAFSRLFLGNILPGDIDKVLYLDSDTIVLGELMELFNVSLDNYYVGGVIDIMANITKYFYKWDDKSLPFINSGVLLINLKKWREIGFGELSINLINEYPDKNFLHDQNIINILCGDNILLLNPKFNVISQYFYVDYKKNLKLNSYFGSTDVFYSENEVKKSLANPIVVHFLSQVWDRPWISQIGIFKHNPKNPFNKCYDYYKSISPWKNQGLESNDKKIQEKLYYEVIRFIMMHFPASVLALLHYIKKG